MSYSYFYGPQDAEQYQFYRIPKLLITGEQFREVSIDAKLLYGLMLDRLSLSIRNSWFDDENRAYIIYTIEEVMEGPRRPGHFSGVAVVVCRLFDLAQPTRAYFGEKDYQQIAVIRSLLEQIKYPIELVPCPIVRADDGLALSSRNMRLSPEARAIAPTINATLEQAAEMAEFEEVDDVKEWVLDTLASFHEINPQPNGLRFEPEYFEIVDAITLQPISDWSEAGDLGAVGCIAVWLDGVRLIDIVKF